MGFAYPALASMLMAKRPAKAARQQDAFFRHLVANMRNGVLAIDRDGSLVILNDEARRLFALEPGRRHHRHARTPTCSINTPTSSACSAARSN